jgi:putative oxidoreductase
MKVVPTIARYILGVIFTVFGLNGFLQFLPTMPLPPLATQFVTTLVVSHFVLPIFLLQLVCGLLFLGNRYVPLALTLIGPILFNILLFHLFMNPSGIGPGALATVCWFLVFNSVRPAFAGIFRNQPQPPAK